MQQAFMWHPAPIKICPAGRRSGKTEILKRKAVCRLTAENPWPLRLFLGAPTHDQSRSLFWDDIRALIPSQWIASVNETRLEIVTIWGHMLRVIGLDRPQRLEGIAWDWAGVDEVASCRPGIFNRNILPALGTLGRTPSCDLIGVPDEVGPNQAEYESLWEKGLNWRAGLELLGEDELKRMNASPHICSFHWRSEDILEPEKIAHFRATMDEFSYQQELGGRFLTSGGKALPRFSVADHVREDFCQYEPRLPLDWSLDFGVGTNARALLAQTYAGHVWIMDEIVCQDGSTEVQVHALRERAAQRGYSLRSVRLFGDVAGHGRNTVTGESDYQKIEELTRDLNIDPMTVRAPIPIKDTINAVRGRLCTADGVVHLHVHPRCKLLIADMKTAPWPDKLTAFHGLAALRYLCYQLFGGQQAVFETSPLSLPMLGRGSGQAAVRRNY